MPPAGAPPATRQKVAEGLAKLHQGELPKKQHRKRRKSVIQALKEVCEEKVREKHKGLEREATKFDFHRKQRQRLKSSIAQVASDSETVKTRREFSE